MKIRGNSHYRNSCLVRSSRNAYRSAAHKGLLGKMRGLRESVGERSSGRALVWQNTKAFRGYLGRGTFIFILLIKKGKKNMKKTVTSMISALLALVLLGCLAACGGGSGTDLWESAIYTADTELGSGLKTVTVEVKAQDKLVTFTIRTDKETVGAALIEQGLLEGEEGPYGLYVKKVNGMLADYGRDQSYWAFYLDGEYAMTGVDGTRISEGAVYQLVYTKE